MVLDYTTINNGARGLPEQPVLMLESLAGNRIGTIAGVSGLKLNIKFSEPSEISFDVPATINGEPNWIYNEISGHKRIYTKNYGVYVLMNPEKESDGVQEVIHAHGFSIEKTLEQKMLFLEEGTYKFYNATSPHDEDTVIGRILEVAPEWAIGEISPTIAQKYRTFPEYDGDILSFVYGDAPEKYHCVFVFDPYGPDSMTPTLNVYDMDADADCLPIYLSFENLLNHVDVEEISDELVTALSPYGADGLDIRAVNPTGQNWLYNIDYFVDNGDLGDELKAAWVKWNNKIRTKQVEYQSLTAIVAANTAEKGTELAALATVEEMIQTLKTQQSVCVQAIASATRPEDIAFHQKTLDDINAELKTVEAKKAAKEAKIASINDTIDPNKEGSYAHRLVEITESLDMRNTANFTPDQLVSLKKFFIESSLTEETFVATDIDQEVSGAPTEPHVATLDISNSVVTRLTPYTMERTVYTMRGGTLTIDGAICDLIRASCDANNTTKTFTFSAYVGEVKRDGKKTARSGMITVSGNRTKVTTDIPGGYDPGTFDTGTRFVIESNDATTFLTARDNEFLKYSVSLELMEHAEEILREVADPSYEFSIESGNFIFANEFAYFKDSLKLGSSIYLSLDGKSTHVIHPKVIEFTLDFENPEEFSIVLSNRFKRKDECNSLRELITKGYNSGRSFEAGKYVYGQTVRQATDVSRFMNSALDAARNAIIGASNQTVRIDGAGIHVGRDDGSVDSKYQLRIVDKMIAMTDDRWAHAKLAAGLFQGPSGNYFGVNAEVIGGNLIVGNNLIIENEQFDSDNKPTGVMQFKVDASGAWLQNSTFVLQQDGGGKILLDPKYGILAGGTDLYGVDGTTVSPSFIKEDGSIIFDSESMPRSSNFFLDLRDGNAYFRGAIHSKSGNIGGWSIGNQYLHSGTGTTFVALNGSGSENSDYAIWAGNDSPAKAPFWVKRDGSMRAYKGDFKGTLNAPNLKGSLTVIESPNAEDGWIKGVGIMCGKKNAGLDYSKDNSKFYVDKNGDMVVSGDIVWDTNSNPCKVLYHGGVGSSHTAPSKPNQSYSYYQGLTPGQQATTWHTTMLVDDLYASYSYDGGTARNWSLAVLIRGQNGKDGAPGSDGSDGSDATVNETNVFNVLTNGGTKFGVFNDSSTGKLYINATYLKAGTVNADRIHFASDWGGVGCAKGNDGSDTTIGIKMYGGSGRNSTSSPYIIVTNGGCRMTYSDTGSGGQFYVDNLGCHSNGSIDTSSDQRLKNSITYDMSRYESFFFKLKPAGFKYNDMENDNLHIGFVAQDVESAMTESGIPQEAFAGVVTRHVEKTRALPDGKSYGLRYGEFVSLNTYMIQRLYARVQELERAIKQEGKGK